MNFLVGKNLNVCCAVRISTVFNNPYNWHNQEEGESTSRLVVTTM